MYAHTKPLLPSPPSPFDPGLLATFVAFYLALNAELLVPPLPCKFREGRESVCVCESEKERERERQCVI